MKPSKPYVNPLAFDYDLFNRCVELNSIGDYGDYEDIWRLFKRYMKTKIRTTGMYKVNFTGVGVFYQKIKTAENNFDPFNKQGITAEQMRYENLLKEVYFGEGHPFSSPAMKKDSFDVIQRRTGMDLQQIQEFQDNEFDR